METKRVFATMVTATAGERALLNLVEE